MNSQVGLKRSNHPQLVNEVSGCPPTKHDSLSFIQEHAAAATKRLAERREYEASATRQMFLPGMDAFMPAMPTSVASSSLFAPIARGKKQYHDQIVLVSRGDATMTYKSHHVAWSKKTLHFAARESKIKHGWSHDNGIYIVEQDSDGLKRIVPNKNHDDERMP